MDAQERMLRASRLLTAAYEHATGGIEVEELARLVVLECDEAGDDQGLILGLVTVGAGLVMLFDDADELAGKAGGRAVLDAVRGWVVAADAP